MPVIHQLAVLHAPVLPDVFQGLLVMSLQLFGAHGPQLAWIFRAMAEPALQVLTVEERSEPLGRLIEFVMIRRDRS